MKKIHFLIRTLTVCIGILSVQAAASQTTGSFDRKVNFGGNPNWTLSYYVPTSYNAANKYKLIIALQGMGQTPQGMRDVMRDYGVNDPASPVYNAIIVAPYTGGDANYNFWYPVSDTGIITKCMTDAISAYNIDPKYIYLNGFSFGGRAALRYGLINYWRFRGIELWSPAIQSPEEANNQTSFTYPYQNAKYIPICITVGAEDGYSQDQRIPPVMEQLDAAGGIATLQIIFGMGHMSPSSDYIFSAYDYLDKNTSTYAVNDARVAAILSPFDEECNTTITPLVVIQNKGTNNLTSATVNYQMDNGTVNTYAWTGNLIRLGTYTVTLPPQTVSVGTHVFKAYTSLPNGASDAVPANDAVTRNFSSLTNGSLTLSEGFEGTVFPPVGWKQAGTDKAWSWERLSGSLLTTDDNGYDVVVPITGGNGQSASCIMFDNYVSDKSGKRYSIRTAQYDLSASTATVLAYDYAYLPLGAGSPNPSPIPDSLAILYSTDCGSTWTQLLKKGGMALSSTGGTTDRYFIPTASQWKKETIGLSSLIGKPKVMFSFESRPGWDNLLFLDNIKLTGITGIVDQAQEDNSLTVYPNPFTESVTIYSDWTNCSLTLMDLTGKIVKSYSDIEQFPFIMERKNISSGMYLLELRHAGQAGSKDKIDRMKLMVE